VELPFEEKNQGRWETILLASRGGRSFLGWNCHPKHVLGANFAKKKLNRTFRRSLKKAHWGETSMGAVLPKKERALKKALPSEGQLPHSGGIGSKDNERRLHGKTSSREKSRVLGRLLRDYKKKTVVKGPVRGVVSHRGLTLRPGGDSIRSGKYEQPLQNEKRAVTKRRLSGGDGRLQKGPLRVLQKTFY